jgi:hypothetical protein
VAHELEVGTGIRHELVKQGRQLVRWELVENGDSGISN